MPKANDIIGPYTLVSKLGRGAFGVVWLAEKRTAITTTKVAIKIPNDEDIDLEAIKQEASLWVHASGHPNVLPIIDADIYDDQVIIVSEYAPDGSLSNWLQRHAGKAPNIETAIEMMLGILAGLEHLHKRGIIHRDLKPDNILLQTDTPRLADFGIARILKTTSKSTIATGTPAYMPPEAFDGKRSEQTDIWSVGVIFHQLLSGHLPFPQTEITSLIGAIISKEPETLPHSIPEPIKDIVKRALEKTPNKRYESAAEMKKALRDAAKVNKPQEAATILIPPTIKSPVPLTPPEFQPKTVPLLQRSEPSPTEAYPMVPPQFGVSLPPTQIEASYNQRAIRSNSSWWIIGGIAAGVTLVIIIALYAFIPNGNAGANASSTEQTNRGASPTIKTDVIAREPEKYSSRIWLPFDMQDPLGERSPSRSYADYFHDGSKSDLDAGMGRSSLLHYLTVGGKRYLIDYNAREYADVTNENDDYSSPPQLNVSDIIKQINSRASDYELVGDEQIMTGEYKNMALPAIKYHYSGSPQVALGQSELEKQMIFSTVYIDKKTGFPVRLELPSAKGVFIDIEGPDTQQNLDTIFDLPQGWRKIKPEQLRQRQGDFIFSFKVALKNLSSKGTPTSNQ